MGFHLERDEEVGSGVRRILTEQTMQLSEDLASVTTDSEKAIMKCASAANEWGPCCVYCVLRQRKRFAPLRDLLVTWRDGYTLLGDLEARGVG